MRRGSGKTKTEARAKLKEVIRDRDDGLTVSDPNFTVADAVADWLRYGLAGRAESTKANYRTLAETHIIPSLGARKIRQLTAHDVDRWLAEKSAVLSTRTLRLLHSLLSRVVVRAMVHDRVKRNVVELCSVPTGTGGRPSKSLTLVEAKAVMEATVTSRYRAYIVLSLLTGARTEELRALTWSRVDLEGTSIEGREVPPSIEVWQSVREGGDTKTSKSRRTLALPARCVEALYAHREQQDRDREEAGRRWQERDLVFASNVGTELDAHNVRRGFRGVVKASGLDPARWTPRELRHSFVSLLSANGVGLEDIADLCGHSGTSVTGRVYRHQLRPVLLGGAVAMDEIFARRGQN